MTSAEPVGGVPDNWHFRVLNPSLESGHTGRVALDIILIGIGWLLAGGSAVLRLRENPGLHPLGNSVKPSRRFNALFFAAIMLAAFGGSGIEHRQHWGFWVVLAVMLPLGVISSGVPWAIRWWQLRRSPTQPANLDSSAGVPPTA